LAKARNWFGLDDERHQLSGSVVVEDWSTDSFQNVLFGLIKFQHYFAECAKNRPNAGLDVIGGSRRPRRLVIVSHEFKRPRFMELHLPALRFPREMVEFIGIDPPWVGERREDMIRGEMERGYTAREKDWYGVGGILDGKRRERGWREQDFIELELGNQKWQGLWPVTEVTRLQMVEIVRWRGGNGRELFGGNLPWA
jgi:hypothetical protein